jgi:hypothetical protein
LKDGTKQRLKADSIFAGTQGSSGQVWVQDPFTTRRLLRFYGVVKPETSTIDKFPHFGQTTATTLAFVALQSK